MLRRPANSRTCRERKGSAAVEFAVVAPLLFLLVLGSIEFGRGMMVSELLAHSARSGARAGVLSSGTNASVTAAVDNNLTSAQIPTTNRTITIKVNGSAGDVSTAASGSDITVTVSVPADSTSWLPTQRWLRGKTLSSTVVMRKE